MASLFKPQQQGSSSKLSRVAFISQPMPSEATSNALLDSTSSGYSTYRPASEDDVPLAPLTRELASPAQLIERSIERYLAGTSKDLKAKCLIAQELLKRGLEQDPQLMDELFLQLLRHLSIHRQSVRAWELLLLALSTAVPSASCTDTVSSFVHSAAKTKVQWPTPASILAKRSKGALLKLLSQPHRRQHVPPRAEIAALLTGAAMKTEVTFLNGSTMWLEFDSGMTVANAVEAAAAQAGIRDPASYALFEAHQLATADKRGSPEPSPLLPDVLLPEERLLVDVLRSLEVKGPQHRLLLKKLRFDPSEESLSKPQLVSLLEAQQAAMDEKSAEISALRSRLSGESGDVVRLQAEQEKTTALLGLIQKELKASEDEREQAERTLKELRQMAVRHTKEQARNKDMVNQLCADNGELKEAVKQAQQASQAHAKAALCSNCGSLARSKGGRSNRAFFLSSINSTEQEDMDIAGMLRGGDGAIDVAVKEALKEKLSQYLSTPPPEPQHKYVPCSEALRISMLHLMKLHTNLGRSALDYQVIAKRAIEHIKQLEQRLDFANAAQKALAEMYTAQKDLDQNKTEQLEAYRDEVTALAFELSAQDAKHKALMATLAPGGRPGSSEANGAAHPATAALLQAAMSKLTLSGHPTSFGELAPFDRKPDQSQRLQSEVEALRPMMRSMQQVDSSPFASDEADTSAAGIAPQSRRMEEPIASAISKEALYELLKEQVALEEEYSTELAAKTAEIGRLRQQLADCASQAEGRPSRSGSNSSSAFSELADEDGLPGLVRPAAESRGQDTAARGEGGSGCGILVSVRDDIRLTASHHWEEEEEEPTELSAALQALQAKTAELDESNTTWQAQQIDSMKATELQVAFAAKEAALDKARADISALRAEDTRKEAQLEARARELESAQLEVAAVQTALASLRSSELVKQSASASVREEHQQAVTILSSQLESARLQQPSVMRDKETELEEARRQLQASTEATMKREADLVQAQEEHRKRTQQIEAVLAAAKSQAGKLEQDVARLEDNVAARERELGQLAETILEVCQERDALLEKLRALEQVPREPKHIKGSVEVEDAGSSPPMLLDSRVSLDWLGDTGVDGAAPRSVLQARPVSPPYTRRSGFDLDRQGVRAALLSADQAGALQPQSFSLAAANVGVPSATAQLLLPADNAAVLGSVQKGQVRTAPASGVRLAHMQEQQSRSRLYSDQATVSRIPKPPTGPQAELMPSARPQKLTGSDQHQSSSSALADRPSSPRHVDRQATSSSPSLLPRSNPTTEDTLADIRVAAGAPKPASCSQESVQGSQEQPAGTAGQAPGVSRSSAPVPQEATSPSARSDASQGRPLSKAGPLTSSGGFAIRAALRNVLNRTRFGAGSPRSLEAAESRLRLRMNTTTQIPMPLLPMDPPISKLAPPTARVLSPEPERPSAFSRRLPQPSKPMPALERVAVPAPPLPQPGMLGRPALRAPTQHRPAARAPTRPTELTVSPFRRRTIAEVYAQTRAAWEVQHESAVKDSSAAAAARAATGQDDAALPSPPVASLSSEANAGRAKACMDGSETVPAGSLKAATDEKAEVPRQQTGAAAAEASDHKRESTSSQRHQTPKLVSAAAALRLNPESAASTPRSAASRRPPGLASTAGEASTPVATSFRRPRSAVAAHQAGRGAPMTLPHKPEEGFGSSVAATASQASAAQPGARDSAVASLKRVPVSGLSQLELPIKPSRGPAAAGPAVPAAVALQRSRHPGHPATADVVEAEQETRVEGVPKAVGQAGSLHENPSAYAANQATASPGPPGPATAGTGAAVSSQGLTAQDNPLFNVPSGSLIDADMAPNKPTAAVPAPPDDRRSQGRGVDATSSVLDSAEIVDGKKPPRRAGSKQRGSDWSTTFLPPCQVPEPRLDSASIKPSGDQLSVFTDDSMEEQFNIGTEFRELIRATLRASGLTHERLDSSLSVPDNSPGHVLSRYSPSVEPAQPQGSRQVKVPAAQAALRRTRSGTAIKAAGGGGGRNPAATVQSTPDIVRLAVTVERTEFGRSSQEADSRSSVHSSDWGSDTAAACNNAQIAC